MLVTIAYCAKDLEQAIRLDNWMWKLGPYPGHKLLVARDASAKYAHVFHNIGFDAVEEIVIANDVWGKWPESCNNAFGEIARYVEELRKEPWLWLEPDVVPMSRGWLDAIEAEYKAAGKPFLGDFVSVHTPELDVPDHMSGVGVYPWQMSGLAGRCLIAFDTAWDVFARDQIVPKMARSKLIHHSWKHAAFENYEQVEREVLAFKPGCVLFHASKDGSLIDILRGVEQAKLSGSAQEAGKTDSVIPTAFGEPRGVKHAGESQKFGVGARSNVGVPSLIEPKGSSAPVCDILIKSYPADYELLGYCLRSIEKFASGFRKIVLILPKTPEDRFPFGAGMVKTPYVYQIEVEEQGEGYLWQQAIKINAHEYSDADYILHIDSDTVLTKPVAPQTFFAEGKPIWMMTPYAQFEQELAANPQLQLGVMAWKPITEKFLGEPIEFEFMRRFPILVPRSLHVAVDVFCRVRHKMGTAEYILNQPHRSFSEFNALGAWAYSHNRADFSWIDTSKVPEAGWPELVAWQTWSHEPLDDAKRTKFEAILSGGMGERRAVGSEMDQHPPSQSSGAVETRSEAMERLCLELRALCTAPAYFKQAHKLLYRAGVVKNVGKRKYRKRELK